MEIVVGPIFEIANMIFAPICEYCKYYKGANKYRRILKEKLRDLERRKSDKTLEMRAQLLPGKTPRQEVEGWIQAIEKLNDEIAIDLIAGQGKCFSRARIGKLAFKKIQEVDGLYQMGDFTGSLVIDPPPSNGEIMSTPTLIGESTVETLIEGYLQVDTGKRVGQVRFGLGWSRVKQVAGQTSHESKTGYLKRVKNGFGSIGLRVESG